MKKSYLSLVFSLVMMISLQAQNDVVITEIMYNPPESGTDSLEFIEIYNNSAGAIDLSDWTISGVNFTFPAGQMIASGEYLVTAVNANAIQGVLGVSALEWDSGGLSNGGETLQLLDAAGNVMDIVNYDDTGDWSSIPDGNGASLVLCDPNADNNVGTNWIAALTSTGATIDGVEIFANPGTAAACPDDPILTFLDNEVTILEDNVEVTASVAIDFGNAAATSVDVIISTLSTATPGDDFTFMTTTLTFPAGVEKDTQTVTINILDDALAEGTEVAAIALVSPTNNASIIGAGLAFVVNIEDNDTEITYTEYTIGEVTETNADGEGTFVDSLVQIQGVVYGVNMRPAGLQFTLIDENNDGIGLFLNSGDLGYTVTEGDEITVQGQVGQFNGLLQITPEQITLVDADNMLFEPTVVTALGEDTESQLVRVEDVSLVDANDWTGAGSGFNVDVTDGTNIYTVRIDADVDLYSMAAPTGTFSVTGLGGQFDNSAPFDAGYQLLPRYVADIDPYNEEEPMEPTYPEYDIDEVTGLNADGEADSLNTTCTLRGIVHGIDFRGGAGVQFTLHDGTDGIGVFSQTIEYYEVNEGDEITVEGTIGQFAGLTQILPDTIIFNSQGNELIGPNVVDEVNENTESELISTTLELSDLTQWAPTGAGFNMDATTPSGEAVILRIDNDCPWFQVAEYPFSDFTTIPVIGIGGQFDGDAPFDGGYQILPRYISDIPLFISTSDLNIGEKVNIFPNPANEELFIEVKDLSLDNIQLTDVFGRRLIYVDGEQRSIDVRILPQGVYTITFTSGAQIYSEQFVKQ